MRLLHITNDLSRNGGTQKFLIDLVSHTQHGIVIKILLINDINDYAEDLEKLGIQVLCWRTLTYRERFCILKWPEIVHSHLFPSIYLALFCFGAKKIQTEHSSHNRRRDHIFLKPFEIIMHRFYDITVCITEKVQIELFNYLKPFRPHTMVIPNGVNLNQFSQRKRKHFNHEELNICMVGRLHPYKDQATIIKAVATLKINYYLHLVGDGSEYNHLQNLVHDLGIKNKVIFHGIRKDIPEFLDSMDLYIQSSNIEGFGISAIEAMASGLPVLGSNVCGLDEVIGNDNYLFEVGDFIELASKIQRIYDITGLYAEMSLYSLNRCKLYSIENFSCSYNELYKSLY